jgi:hypothetical protein
MDLWSWPRLGKGLSPSCEQKEMCFGARKLPVLKEIPKA